MQYLAVKNSLLWKTLAYGIVITSTYIGFMAFMLTKVAEKILSCLKACEKLPRTQLAEQRYGNTIQKKKNNNNIS